MDYVRALTFVTEDPRWKEKIAIGTVVVLLSSLLMPILVGIVGMLILYGYAVRLLQNLRDGQPYPLPEWDRWSDDLSRGFKLAVVGLVWALPIVLVILPVALGSSMTAFDNGFLVAMGSLILMFGTCLTIAYGLFLVLMMPGINIWFARDEQIRSGIAFTDIWQWTRTHLSKVLLFTLAYIVASAIISAVAGLAGFVLCLVGLIVTVPLGQLITTTYQYHLLGQIAYEDATGKPFYTPAPPVTPAAPGRQQRQHRKPSPHHRRRSNQRPAAPVMEAQAVSPAPAEPPPAAAPETAEAGEQTPPPDQPQG